jgi:nucleotidyltransferase/DNA polymerase involved in DNA repair
MFYYSFMRVACVYIPHFYLQAECLGNPDLEKKPVVIVAMPEEKGFVLDCSEELVKRGVSPLMPFREACQLCFDAVPIFVRRRVYADIWDNILSSIAEVTLRIEAKEPGIAFLDVTRLPGMYKSEEQLALALIGLISDRFHLKANAGIGNSRFMACEAALSATTGAYVVREGTERTFLSSINTTHLPVSEAVLEKLHLLGLDYLGQIGAFTLSALTSQFGATGKILWEIVNGVEEQDRIPCAFSITDVDETMVCDEPLYSRDQIKIALLTLLEKLCLELEDLGKACRAIKLVFDLRNRSFIEKQFFLSPPTAHKEDMLRRIMAGLEQVELPSPIQIMSVRASSLVHHGGKQEKLFRLRSSLTRSMADMSGLLRTKYGSMPVGRVVENNTKTLLPDDRYVFVDP